MKRAFIIHGWEGSPTDGWFPWLQQELQSQGFEVFVPKMPHPDEPIINDWVNTLTETVGTPNGELYFIGHSTGCQTILRYIELLPKTIQIKQIVLVAPWFKLNPKVIEEEGEETERIAKPWMETPIDFQKIKNQVEKVVAIYSDDDPYVLLEEQKIFKDNLNADIITEHKKWHFDELHGNKTLPAALRVIEA